MKNQILKRPVVGTSGGLTSGGHKGLGIEKAAQPNDVSDGRNGFRLVERLTDRFELLNTFDEIHEPRSEADGIRNRINPPTLWNRRLIDASHQRSDVIRLLMMTFTNFPQSLEISMNFGQKI